MSFSLTAQMEKSLMNMHVVLELSVLNLAVASPSHLQLCFSFLSMLLSQSFTQSNNLHVGAWLKVKDDIHKEYAMRRWKFKWHCTNVWGPIEDNCVLERVHVCEQLSSARRIKQLQSSVTSGLSWIKFTFPLFEWKKKNKVLQGQCFSSALTLHQVHLMKFNFRFSV